MFGGVCWYLSCWTKKEAGEIKASRQFVFWAFQGMFERRELPARPVCHLCVGKGFADALWLHIPGY